MEKRYITIQACITDTDQQIIDSIKNVFKEKYGKDLTTSDIVRMGLQSIKRDTENFIS